MRDSCFVNEPRTEGRRRSATEERTLNFEDKMVWTVF